MKRMLYIVPNTPRRRRQWYGNLCVFFVFGIFLGALAGFIADILGHR